MENVKFSVLIPVYNCKEYIVPCVNSILSQRYGNLEIILADDGSTDGSAEICDGFGDARVKAFHKKNEGPLLTRVFAVSKASGDYCLFIDCDDYIDDGYFSRLSGIIERENCDMVVCSFRHVGSDGTYEAATPWKEEKVFSGEEADSFRREFLLNNYLNSMCTKVIRSDILRQDATDFSEFAQYKHGEDLIQALYPVFNSQKIVYIPECWYNYRENDSSITHTADADRYKSIFAAREHAFGYLEKASFFNDEVCGKFTANIVKSVMGCVKRIAKSDLTQKDKEDIFDDINDNPFYSGTVMNCFNESLLDTKTKVIFRLFKIRSYKTVITLISHFSR